MNKFHLIGFLGRDAEIKLSQSGKEFANISIACRDKNTNNDIVTHWFNIGVFGDNLVAMAKNYFKKGCCLSVEGKIKMETYLDQQGVKHTGYSFAMTSFEFVGRNESGQQAITTEQVADTQQVQQQTEAQIFPTKEQKEQAKSQQVQKQVQKQVQQQVQQQVQEQTSEDGLPF